MNEELKKQLAEEIKEAIQDSLLSQTRFGNPPLVTGNLLNSVQVIPVSDGFEIYMADYWDVIENGRVGRGNLPPIQPIFDWIQAKRIRPRDNNMTPRSLAWAIAQSLKTKTIAPRPFLQQGIDNVSSKILDEFVLSIINREL
jgi:hypothetical protein